MLGKGCKEFLCRSCRWWKEGGREGKEDLERLRGASGLRSRGAPAGRGGVEEVIRRGGEELRRWEGGEEVKGREGGEERLLF